MVIIKSYQNGLSLHISSTDPFEDILNEIGGKFEESKKFFKNASVALSIEGRNLSTDEEKAIIQVINEHSDLQIICLVGKDSNTNKSFVKALKKVETQKEENNCRFFTGDVFEDQVVESEGNLVIYGNVNAGATIAAAKSVIVLGNLDGEVYAGLNNESGNFITAVRMNPSKAKIGALKYVPGSKGLFNKKKNEVCIIFEKDGELVSEIISPEILANVTSI